MLTMINTMTSLGILDSLFRINHDLEEVRRGTIKAMDAGDSGSAQLLYNRDSDLCVMVARLNQHWTAITPKA